MSEHHILYLRSLSFTWVEIALLGISRLTLYQRREGYGSIEYPRTIASNAELIQELRCELSFCGEDPGGGGGGGSWESMDPPPPPRPARDSSFSHPSRTRYPRHPKTGHTQYIVGEDPGGGGGGGLGSGSPWTPPRPARESSFFFISSMRVYMPVCH